MRKWMLSFLLLPTVLGAETTRWTLSKPSFWARDPAAAIFHAADGVCVITSQAAGKDWALAGIAPIDVKRLDRVVFSGEAQGDSASKVTLAFLTTDEAGKVLNWSLGSHPLKLTADWCPFQREIVVPPEVARLMPRILGNGFACCRFRNVRLEKLPCVAVVPAEGSVRLGAAEFRFGLKGFSFAANGFESVSDPTWLVLSNQVENGSAVFHLFSFETSREYTATFKWDGPELGVALAGRGELEQRLVFPPPFKTVPGDRLILPENEGMGYPVDESDLPLANLTLYFGSGHGLCMAFYGCAADATGHGWMTIVETQDDAYAQFVLGANGCWQVRTQWGAQKKQFGYPRRQRFVFFTQGGHVAMAKRYRRYAQTSGRLKTFREKAKERPVVDKLIGAANIWYFGNNKTNFVAELQRRGVDRILWSGGGTAAELAAMNTMTNVLTSRYDIYSDVMDPALCPLIGHKSYGDWPVSEEAFPKDILRDASGQMQRAWGIETLGKTGMVYCVSLCDAKSYLYARRRIGRELKEKPFKCRFLDTVTACAWTECWDPAHPLTRTDSKKFRIQLLNVVSGEFGLVCGSETGLDAVVPVCDYFEGMLSIGRFRVPDAGRRIQVIWDKVPELVAKFQLGERYRLPLWELVYHDCCVAQWYWGDYNNKLPKLWAKRDLFNALYGTPPMYMCEQKDGQELMDAFAQSYRIAEPVSRLTGYWEMTDHELLSSDRTVQRTTFANGVHVTVNFGAKPFTETDGTVLAPMTSRIEP